jgi:WD40 repeat protein
VTGSLDKTAKVWDTKTGQELMTLTGHDGRVMSAAHSPDGPWIVTASNDGTVQIYTTDMEELLEIAKSRVTRQLTTEEKEKYGGAD